MYPLPSLESKRLIALDATHIIDSGSSPEFDAVVALVRDTLNIPICLVSLVDANRQWFKAKCGLNVDGTDRDLAFCSYALLSDDVLIVKDACADSRFASNPLVTGEPHIRFYAGAPLLISPGIALGTLCVIDTEPREMSPSEVLLLRRLAQVVTSLIRGHGLAYDAAAFAREAECQRLIVEEQARDLRLRERRFLQTEQIAKVGGWDVDLDTGTVSWSDETYRIYEIPLGTSISLDLALSAYPDKERARLTNLLERTLQNSTGYDDEFEFITASGALKWVRVVGEAELYEGKPRRLFGTFQDVTERHRSEERLWKAANRDSLTGLFNRNYFDNILASTSTSDAVGGILMVDADHLKDVNDTLGHDAGDELIRIVARRLREAVGEDGTVARVGGDEFAVLVSAPADMEKLAAVANGILTAMRPWVIFKGNTLKPIVSIGGGLQDISQQPQEVCQLADLALYHAKATSRGGYVVYQDDMKSAITARTHAVDTIDEALIAGDIVAWYQPVVELATGRISGLEALARVRRGNVIRSIGEFAEALHDHRTAARLTTCMLDCIEVDITRWRAAGVGIPRIAFNVGAIDFQEGLIEKKILSLCERTGVEPSQFALEITETVFLSRGASAISEVAKRIRSRGIIVALDDFGTGHASLAHLGSFPVDVIKMDRSFIHRMNDDGPGAIIAAALIDVAQKLGIQVVAEGVENHEQLDRLISLGCEKAQGYLFSKALPPDLIIQFLSSFQPSQFVHLKKKAS